MSSRSPGPSAIVVSKYNDSITSVMLEGAVDAYTSAGGSVDSLAILEAPGAFELVSIAGAAADSGMYESVVCLGCVIKGETSHDVHISNAVAVGIAEISIKTGVPVAFGVLTTNTIEQARARAGGEVGNKGAEAMNAVLGAAGAISAINTAKAQNSPGVHYTPGFEVPDKAVSRSAIASEGM
ncbi:MAG: 6,7-dimethyl-8-ribityllumazine synthase [Phycisphaerales bacterium]|nr:6,7-dimethyl-8-ribityllumazine synthase [Phycisphaerales bacterium]